MREQSETPATPPLIELRSVWKSFGGTPALKNISLRLARGSFVGLIGENGAGKSTLIKLLSGVHQPDGGEIRLRGAAARLRSPHEARAQGIATIHQELCYFEKLTVAENLFLDAQWPRWPWGGTKWTELFAKAGKLLDRFDLSISPGAFFNTLSAAQRQEIAIARALSQQAEFLILDEPTASLTEPEVERLFANLERLRTAGITLLYVSHRLDEILRLAERVIVLRDGEVAGDYPAREATIPRMVRDMVGRTLEQSAPRRGNVANELLLEVEGLSKKGLFCDLTFQVQAGEVLGLAGLVGAGRSELARCIYGLYSPDTGAIRLVGKEWRPSTPEESCRAGLVYVPEERKRQGFVLQHSTREGISIGFLRWLQRFGIILPGEEKLRVSGVIDRFGIRARSTEQSIGTLSGGNQQKALLARWLETDPQFVILDEPTRGVDVGAKAEIHRLIDQLAQKKKGVLLISSDLPELLALSDRVIVLHQGRLVAELRGDQKTQENILFAASGIKKN